MNHIDKLNPIREANGIKVAQATLDGQWDSVLSHYRHSLNYNNCDHDAIRNFLLDEQTDANVGSPVCCYCMRRLYHRGSKDSNVTIEHIIPKGITEDKWVAEKGDYQSFQALSDDKVNVCFGGNYSDATKKVEGLPHPHFMSYHNMVASCDGGLMISGTLEHKQCCNEKRNNHQVSPMFFSDKIHEEIIYTPDGDIQLENSDFKKSWLYPKRLNLLSSELKKMRRFWYLVSTTEYTAKDIEAAVSDQEIRDEIQNVFDKFDKSEWQSLGNTDYLQWLSSYCWFYYYYKNEQTN